MARPRYRGKIYRMHITLCLREGEDDDLISLLVDEAIKPGDRAQTVKTMMRQGHFFNAGGDEVDEEQLAAGLDDLML